jgi:glycosyltransferase involved in cell wall biosynthesis
MGKNNKRKTNKHVLPFVSVCTPTFNRRPFIPFMIKCFEHQTYPKDRMEWIIIDDGTDPIEDLVKHIPQVKYFYYDTKMLLGKKRNLMHTKCTGDIIVYMDDDDYYPPERVSHAVEMLQANPRFLIAGTSEMHVYYDSRHKVFQCGPYKDYQSTAATFAFKKELLNQTKYDDTMAMSEEQKFTKGYTIPLIQLNPLQSILVFSHKHNSLNKEQMLEHPEQTKITPSPYTVDDFVKDPILKQFYVHDMNTLLENYEPGRPENKPEILKQIKIVDEERAKRMKEHQDMVMNTPKYTQADMLALQNECNKKLSDNKMLVTELLKRVKELTKELQELKSKQI